MSDQVFPEVGNIPGNLNTMQRRNGAQIILDIPASVPRASGMPEHRSRADAMTPKRYRIEPGRARMDGRSDTCEARAEREVADL
ncbi:hypothetical protein [Roseobacter ponti]|uniref:Uncharacterized protein n=1 Tax=Roseobacter ponti TaxID=1891787 RepID=A0A858SR83_9RHOB|nr:hypothetical protein [Roseobacter ponti]QJF50131.1 hypothetical protein G3256_02580 [Roseobacter ponti]